jgi:hypothetical protein
MIPVIAIKPILQFFDAIDECCTEGLMNKRPHNETTITQILCSLLEQEEQKQFNLKYSFEDLRQALLDSAVSLKVGIENHEYNSSLENRVTQSDLGLIINYINEYEDEAWTESWLFQAKRLIPTHQNPLTYLAESEFESITKDQTTKMQSLEKLVKVDFIRFMEYCPRAYKLEKTVRNKLLYYKDRAFRGSDFQNALGLEIHNSLVTADQTLTPGIFISCVEDYKRKFYIDLYKGFWKNSYPFSWFILQRLYWRFNRFSFLNEDEKPLESNRITINPSNLYPELNINDNDIEPAALAHAIVRCDQEAINYVLRGIGGNEGTFQIFPARTMTIEIRIGGD